jgi:hypothetical protein
VKLGGKWDPDPKKIVSDPQHWNLVPVAIFYGTNDAKTTKNYKNHHIFVKQFASAP